MQSLAFVSQEKSSLSFLRDFGAFKSEGKGKVYFNGSLALPKEIYCVKSTHKGELKRVCKCLWSLARKSA
jgi:hypothetical protein